MLRWLVLTVLLSLAATAAAQPAAEKRVALIIGNGAYADSPLRNPVNDARSMAAALKELGFDTTIVENGNRTAMQKAILAFGKALEKDSVGLFYYAGHGMQVKGSNYLIPVGADIRGEDEVEVEAVDANYVLARLATAGNRLNIVILDACRDNPFARSFRSSGGRGLAAINAPTGTLIAYATAPGATAGDGDGANGLYTGALVEAIKRPGLKIEDVFKQARMEVVGKSAGQQTPWESSSVMGDFYFRQQQVARSATPMPAPVAGPPSVPRGAAVPENALACPRRGMLLKTSAGDIEFVGGDGVECRQRSAEGRVTAKAAVFWGANQPAYRQAGEEFRKLWPLEVGKSVKAHFVNPESTGSFDSTYTVTGKTKLTVPAGTFDTYVIEWLLEGRDGNGHRSRNTYWYAPELRYVVKFEPHAERGVLHGYPAWEALEIGTVQR